MSTATLTQAPSSFEYIRKLVFERSAIALEPNKGYLVESRLLPLARDLGLASLDDLVEHLRARPYGPAHVQVVEAMTTNETSFFRDLHPFQALKDEVLPAMLRARAARRSLNIWCAACSSGQEPYSIAILLAENFPQFRDWNVQVFASDLSRQMVDRAQAGLFSQLEVNRGLPAPLLAKYFTRAGLQWEVKSEVRKPLRFLQVNLIEPWPALPTLDVIFMRNVLIYFNADTKRAILDKVYRQLAADGSLFLGGAETTIGIDSRWERVNHGKTSSYRRAAATS
jgi:chemotaxis protein methyltransferase CheR